MTLVRVNPASMSRRMTPAAERRGRSRWVGMAVGALAILGATLVWYATTAGAGINYDAVDYAHMAARIRSGRALSITHFPPGLPLVLALSADPFAAARVLNIVALSALVTLTGAAVWWSTRKSAPTLFAAVVVAVGTPLLAVHVMALSEPLALVSGSVGLWLTLVALADDQMWIWCVAALALGLAVIVRYAAVVYPISAVLFVLWERRQRRAALVATLSAVPLAAWLARNVIVTHAPTDRSIVYHPIPRRAIELGREVVSTWLDPTGFVFGRSPRTEWLAVVAAAALFAWGLWRGNKLAKLASLFAVSYVVFLLFVIAFLDAGSTLNSRLLVPVFVCAIWVAAALLSSLVAGRDANVGWSPPRWLASAAVGLAGLFVVAHVYAGLRYVSRIHRQGVGAASTVWRRSKLVNAVRSLPNESVVWTNDELELSLFTHAALHELPSPLEYTTHRPTRDYAAALAAIPDGAFVADFTRLDVGYPSAVPDLARTKGLDTLISTHDGALYRVR